MDRIELANILIQRGIDLLNECVLDEYASHGEKGLSLINTFFRCMNNNCCSVV